MANTLLEFVQTILSDMDGDEVNSISDTPESEQVASIVKSTYNAIVSHTVWPHTRRAVALWPRSDNNFPTHMTIRDDLKELISVRYNKAMTGEARKDYRDVVWCDPDDFLRKTNYRDNTQTNVDVVLDDSGIELLLLTDKAPDFYTSFDDKNLVFDSYDALVDNTLQQSKFQAQGYIIPEFLLQDSFVPDLPADAFSLLLEESISRCQFKLRQFQDMKSETEAQKQSRYLSQKSWTVAGGIRYRNYGRSTRRVQGVQPWPNR
tara:strand:- start:12912 stop:13697 length:786 start_codon:yes stop_codon:yes gene_type:complete